MQAQTAAVANEAVDGESRYEVSNVNGGLGVGLETRTGARLEAIVAALARIEDGTYGICSGCQTPIPYGRLIVMPEATLCMACGRA
jgi:RNA polymerase-binding transcription factor DksA